MRARVETAAIAIRPARIEKIVFVITAPVWLLQFFAQAVEANRFVIAGSDAQMLISEGLATECALAARRVAYGEELAFSGPTYRSHEARAGRIVLAFDHAGGGLVARGDAGAPLRGFAVAGADRRFVWAEAAIEGDRVAVWSERVPAPVAVRYAWADNPEGANLDNAAGLPASPFRTDDW